MSRTLINLKLAFRNVLRHRHRSFISVLAISVGVISIVLAGGFLEDTLKLLRESYIRGFIGHIRVYKPGFRTEGLLHPFDYMISGPAALVNTLRRLPHVRYVASRLSTGGLISNGEATLPVTIDSVDPNLETLKLNADKIEEGQRLTSGAEYDVLLGRGIRAAVGAHVADPLILVSTTRRGSMNALDLTVRGVFSTASKEYDDHVVQVPLATVQKLLHTEDVQALVLYLDKTEDTDRVVTEIRALFKREGLDYEVMPWYDLEEADFVHKVTGFYHRIYFVLKLIIMIVVALSIANTMNMSVLERVGEIGTLMALGTKPRGVTQLFLAEGLFLGLFGGACGVLLGATLAMIISRIGIPMPPTPGTTQSWLAHIAVVPSVLATAWALALGTALLSAVLPARKAANLEIAEALRHNL